MPDLVLGAGVQVHVEPPAVPVVRAAPPATAAVTVLPVAGPAGPVGPEHVTDWFTGAGPPPPVIPGAGPGDMYIDELDGQLYQLH